MAHAQKPEVTQEEVNKARHFWSEFTVWMKWGTISVIILLGLMAATLV